MSKADVLHSFRRITSDAAAAAQVAAADLSVLGEVELSPDEQEMLIGAAAELCDAGDEVAGFQWVDPAGGGNDDLAAETSGESKPGLTFTRTGDIRPETRYVKQLTIYVGLGKPGF